MITQQEREELRQDCLTQAREDEREERMMRSDLDYFLDNSNYSKVVDELLIWKKEAKMYDRCITDLIKCLEYEL